MAGLKHFGRTHRDSLPLQVVMPDGRQAVAAAMDWIGGEIRLQLRAAETPSVEETTAALNAEMVASAPEEQPRRRGRPRKPE